MDLKISSRRIKTTNHQQSGISPSNHRKRTTKTNENATIQLCALCCIVVSLFGRQSPLTHCVHDFVNSVVCLIDVHLGNSPTATDHFSFLDALHTLIFFFFRVRIIYGYDYHTGSLKMILHHVQLGIRYFCIAHADFHYHNI